MPKAMTSIPFKWEKFKSDMHKHFPSEGIRASSAAAGLPHQAIIRAKNGTAVSVPAFLALCKAMKKNPFAYAE